MDIWCRYEGKIVVFIQIKGAIGLVIGSEDMAI